jgi:hypothetical protein
MTTTTGSPSLSSTLSLSLLVPRRPSLLAVIAVLAPAVIAVFTGGADDEGRRVNDCCRNIGFSCTVAVAASATPVPAATMRRAVNMSSAAFCEDVPVVLSICVVIFVSVTWK